MDHGGGNGTTRVKSKNTVGKMSGLIFPPLVHHVTND